MELRFRAFHNWPKLIPLINEEVGFKSNYWDFKARMYSTLLYTMNFSSFIYSIHLCICYLLYVSSH